jgi:CRISPR-associated protein Csb1
MDAPLTVLARIMGYRYFSASNRDLLEQNSMSVSSSDLVTARALRTITQLEPIDGPGGRVFPMTALGDRGGQHVVEEGPEGRRVLIDSCASQANRQEAAILAARERGELELADIVVDLAGTAAHRTKISTLEMPHRVADAILRDSELDGLPFAQSATGRAILGATYRDLTPILTASPVSLVFGTWFSQHGLSTFGLKIERASVGEIWGHGAQLGKAIGSRIDPLGLIDLPIYRAQEGGWTADPAEAAIEKSRPAAWAKKKTSELNHSNIPPTILERGVICERYELRWSLNSAAIRRQGFGDAKRSTAAQMYLLALGLAARVLAHEEGYALRSRCCLLAKGPLTVELIGRDGDITEQQLDSKAALKLLHEAQTGLVAAGFPPPAIQTAKPSKRLIGLIAKSHEAAAAEAQVEVA